MKVCHPRSQQKGSPWLLVCIYLNKELFYPLFCCSSIVMGIGKLLWECSANSQAALSDAI